MNRPDSRASVGLARGLACSGRSDAAPILVQDGSARAPTSPTPGLVADLCAVHYQYLSDVNPIEG